MQTSEAIAFFEALPTADQEAFMLSVMEAVNESAYMPLLEWTREHRQYLAPNKPFNEHDHKYMLPIYEDDCQAMTLSKAGQMGASEYLVSWLMWGADKRKATGLYVFPNDRLISAFSAARFGPATEPKVSPYLASIVKPSRS